MPARWTCTADTTAVSSTRRGSWSRRAPEDRQPRQLQRLLVPDPAGPAISGAYDARLRTFIASTPRNVVLTNHHEPEQEIEAGQFTFAQFRAANARLNRLVDEQNAIDGGTRKVSVILMISTFTGFQGRNAENYWPTVAKGDGGTVDLISADVYAAPHGTGTTVPVGYTTGTNWKTAQTLVRPVLSFARLHVTDWAISELGILEDVNNPNRKSQLMRDVVAYASAGRLDAHRCRVPPGAVGLLLELARRTGRLGPALPASGPVRGHQQPRLPNVALDRQPALTTELTTKATTS